MGRKKIFVWLLAAGLLFTAGCSKKAEKIKRVEETQTEEAEETTKQDDFAQFREEATWDDDLKGNCHGQEADISIYASIILPDDAQTSAVAEGRMIYFDNKYKENALNGVFGDADIYYHDKAHWTIEELEKEIEEEEHWQEIQGKKNVGSEEKKNLEELKTYLASAGRKYTKATDFSADEYIAKKNGIWCTMEFIVQENGSHVMYFDTLKDDLYVREGFGENAKTMTGDGDFFPEEDSALNQEDNLCKFSREEAEKEVMDFAGKAGIENPVCTYIVDQFCTAEDASGKSDTELYGYRISIGMGVNGESLVGKIEDGGYFGDARVTDEGVVTFNIKNPVELRRISEHVSLLSLDKIKEALRRELKQHLDDYCTYKCTRFRFDSLDLRYLWQMKDKTTGEGASIPVWVLTDSTNDVRIYVNAIDGTVLDKDNLQ